MIEKLEEWYKKYSKWLDERNIEGNLKHEKTIKAFDNKLLVLKSKNNTLRFLPPLTIEDDEIEDGFAILCQKVLKDIK